MQYLTEKNHSISRDQKQTAKVFQTASQQIITQVSNQYHITHTHIHKHNNDSKIYSGRESGVMK